MGNIRCFPCLHSSWLARCFDNVLFGMPCSRQTWLGLSLPASSHLLVLTTQYIVSVASSTGAPSFLDSSALSIVSVLTSTRMSLSSFHRTTMSSICSASRRRRLAHKPLHSAPSILQVASRACLIPSQDRTGGLWAVDKSVGPTGDASCQISRQPSIESG
jgi:hypothetical protein